MEGEQGANSMIMQGVQLLPEDQLVALQQEMVESQASYQHKLKSSQEAQHRQAVLVQKLQAKVIQYRKWCNELEQRLEANKGSISYQWDRKDGHSLEKALIQLEEEQQRCENLAGMNNLLREHVDKANEVNAALREDVNKLMADWTNARDELKYKESEWHKEREFFDSYVRAEHERILGIWKQVVTFHRSFLEMKTATDRDLSELKAEQVKLSRSILVSCFRLSSDAQIWETNSLGKPALRDQTHQQKFYGSPEKTDVEQAMCGQPQTVLHLHVKGNLEKEDLQSRVVELTALLEESQKQNEEKEKIVMDLRNTVELLEANRLEIENECLLNKNANEEILSFKHVIKEITQEMINESDTMSDTSHTESYPESCSSLQQNHCDPDGALFLVRDVLSRRKNDMQQLKQQLLASQNSVRSLETQQEQQEEQCCLLKQRLEQLEQERDTHISQLQHFQTMVETCHSDHAIIEKSRKELQQQLEVLEQEARDLRQSNTKLQLKGDVVDGEKEEQQQELERALREKQYIQEDRNSLEEKHSWLKNEFVAMKEALEKSQLEGELVKQENNELALALEQAQQSFAVLNGTHNKLMAETADLRAVAAKMSALNEALTLDKVNLNQLILKLEQENQTVLEKVDNLERIRTSSQNQLAQTERTNKELHAEKIRLEQLLCEEKELQESLQEELRGLRDEQKETHEKLSQAHRQHKTSITDLEQANEESRRLGDMLATVSREKEFLTREKAALEVRLGAAARESLTLTEQMAEFRSAKELLESNLFQAQQQVSELEVTNGQLEMKVQAISQTKEVIQGEVKCLCIELEEEKAKIEKEKEKKAQQLAEAEQKYQETLHHLETVHQEKMNSLFQELEGEREQHRIELELMSKEKEETENIYEKKLQELQQEFTAVQRQMEEDLIKSTNIKQKELIEKETERKSLLEELLQTKEVLTTTCQELEFLRLEGKQHQEREQILGTELRDVQSTMGILEKKNREEIKNLKEERNFLLQQQINLQSQVQSLESQLLMAKDSCQLLRQEAQQHLREVQELSKQKALEVAHFQKMLESERKHQEEVAYQNTELQKQKKVLEEWNTELRATIQNQQKEEQHLNQELQRKQEEVEHQYATVQALEKKLSQWEEADRQNSERYISLQRQWEETKRENKELQKLKNAVELQNVELQHQKEEVELLNAELKAVIQGHEKEAAREALRLQSHLEEVQLRNSEFQNWKEKAEEKNAELQALLHHRQEMWEHQNLELQTKQNEIESQNALLQRLKKEQSQLQHQKEEVELQNAELNAVIQRHKKEAACECARLQGHLEEVQLQNSELQNLKEKVEEKNEELQALLHRQQEVWEHQNLELQTKQNEIESQNALLQRLKKEQSQLQHQKEEVELQNAELNAVIQRHKKEAACECARLQGHLEEVQLQNSELQNLKEKVEEKNEELQALLHRQQEVWEHQNLELQIKQNEIESQNALLQRLKKEESQWEETECQKMKLKMALETLEEERASLAAFLEEKEARLLRLQDSDDAYQDKIAKLNSELQQAQQLLAEHRREVHEQKDQIQSLKQMMLKKEADLISQKEQLFQNVQELRTNEQRLKDSVKMLEAESSQLRLNLCGAESRAEALASECQRACSARWEAQSQLSKLHSVLHYMLCNSPDIMLEHGGRGDQTHWNSSLFLSREQDKAKGLTLPSGKDLSTEITVERVAEAILNLRQDLWQARLQRDEMRKNSEILKHELCEKEVERDRINAKFLELQKWSDQSQEDNKTVEGKQSSLESALKAEVIAFKEENVTLHGRVATLEKLLESTEKQRKDVLIERDTLLMAQEKLVWELDLLRESVNASAIQANAMEKMNQSLEQELQTTLSTLKIKHEEAETQQVKFLALEQEIEVQKGLQESLDNLTVDLAKRDEEIKSQLQQIRDLENYREMQNAAVEHLTKELEKKDQESESQEKQIEELEKQNKIQNAALERLSLNLEETLQTMQVEQEKMQKLEELTHNQRSMIESLTLNFEEKVKEIKTKEEKIQILENNELSQIGTLLKEVGELKTQLIEKDWELTSQKQLLQEQEEQEKKQVNTLQTSLENTKFILNNKEKELECQREQILNFQQCVAQREMHLHEVSEKVKQMTFALALRDQELESQKQQIKEMEGEMKTELKALQELLAQTQRTLKEKVTELELQRKLEEEVERQVKVLFGDVTHRAAMLNQRDSGGKFQGKKELDIQETTLEMLQHLKVIFRESEQKIESLKEQHEEHKEKMEKQVKELQSDFEQALRNGEGQLESLNHQLQQQEEEAVTQTKTILEKLEHTKSCLQDRDQVIESLKGHIEELSRQKEQEKNNVKKFQQELARIKQLMKEKEEELLKQSEQINTYQLKVEEKERELQANQIEGCHLAELIREQEQEINIQKQQNKHEQVDSHHLQLVMLEKRQREREEFKKDQEEREKDMKSVYERTQKQLKDKIEDLQKYIKHLQHLLKKKDDKWHTEKVKQLEEIIRNKEMELLTLSEQRKQIISALNLQDSQEGSVKSHIQKLQVWKEEEAAKSKLLQEKDQQLEWQKVKIQQLEDEKRVKSQELDRVMTVLKQTESEEIEWREKAQKCGLSLAQSEEALSILRKEMATFQTMISEREKDRLHLQEQLEAAIKALQEERLVVTSLTVDVDLVPSENDMSDTWQKGDGDGEPGSKDEGLTGMAKTRHLYKRMELLEQAVVRLENEKLGLEQHNTQLKNILEQVERERRKLKKSVNHSLNSPKLSQVDSAPQKSSSLSKEEALILQKELAELQKQVSDLQKQLLLERKQRQNYIDSYSKTNQALSGLHQELSISLAAVAREPEATVLESETRKLDETLNHSFVLGAVGFDGLLPVNPSMSSTPKTAQQKSNG